MIPTEAIRAEIRKLYHNLRAEGYTHTIFDTYKLISALEPNMLEAIRLLHGMDKRFPTGAAYDEIAAAYRIMLTIWIDPLADNTWRNNADPALYYAVAALVQRYDDSPRDLADILLQAAIYVLTYYPDRFPVKRQAAWDALHAYTIRRAQRRSAEEKRVHQKGPDNHHEKGDAVSQRKVRPQRQKALQVAV